MSYINLVSKVHIEEEWSTAEKWELALYDFHELASDHPRFNIMNKLFKFFNTQSSMHMVLDALNDAFKEFSSIHKLSLPTDLNNHLDFDTWYERNKSMFMLPIPTFKNEMTPGIFKVKYKQYSVLSRFFEWMFFKNSKYTDYSGLVPDKNHIAKFVGLVNDEIADRWIKDNHLFVDDAILHGKYSHLLQLVLIMIGLKNQLLFLNDISQLKTLLTYLMGKISIKGTGEELTQWDYLLDYAKRFHKNTPFSINAMFLSDWVKKLCPEFSCAYRIHYTKRILHYLIENKMSEENIAQAVEKIILEKNIYQETGLFSKKVLNGTLKDVSETLENFPANTGIYLDRTKPLSS